MTAIIDILKQKKPISWLNPRRLPIDQALGIIDHTADDLARAVANWQRFAPLLAHLFPELKDTAGIIESPLLPLPKIAAALGIGSDRLWLKGDHALPVAGSVKARGGVYAVLKVAEKLALEHGILTDESDDYLKLAGSAAQRLFSGQTLTVASTGNLGYSLGVTGSALGFKVRVHMSQEAQEWKKERLRSHGATVVEHATDYTKACVVAHAEAAADPNKHYIDDENSLDLFMGYAASLPKLKKQLDEAGVVVDADHPLYLYLPCGVGGAPGGITWAARLIFGDNAHAFFVEPVEAPSVLLGLLTGKHSESNVNDIGLYLRTIADGLAVAQPSRFVGKLMETLLDGCITVTDTELYRYVLNLYEQEKIEVEPSAASGLPALARLLDCSGIDNLAAATHIAWSTGGSHVPPQQHEKYRLLARQA